MATGIINRVAIHEGSAPGANTDILASALTPSKAAAYRFTIQLTVSSIFNVMIGKTGNTTQTCALNDNGALTAGALYTFTMGVDSDQTYNFQVETDGQIDILQVDEVTGGVI
jgi:hypothetical protein